MFPNPFRLFERRERLRQAALEKAHDLRRRYEGEAIAAAHEKLKDRDLTKWGRRILTEAIKLLETKI